MVLSVYTNEGRQMAVAYAYERLVRHLLKSNIPSQEDWFKEKGNSHFDLYHEELGAMVEIKGSSNMDQLKLFDNQLDEQISELGFPFEKGFVWIFSYINCSNTTVDGVHTSQRLLKEHKNSFDDFMKFIIQQTNTAYVIEIHLLDAWRRKYGTRKYNRDQYNPRKTVRINRTDLRHMSKHTRATLFDLGFYEQTGLWLPHNANSIRTRRVKTEIDGLKLNFELYPILPTRMKSSLMKQLNGSVEKI
jgi:hypothetical protein